MSVLQVEEAKLVNAGEFRIIISIYSKEILRQLAAFEDLYSHLPKRNGNQDLLEWREFNQVLKLDLETVPQEAVQVAFKNEFYLSKFSYVLIFSGLRSSMSYVPRAVLYESFDDLCPATKPHYIFGMQDGVIQIESLDEYDGWRWVIGGERALDLTDKARG